MVMEVSAKGIGTISTCVGTVYGCAPTTCGLGLYRTRLGGSRTRKKSSAETRKSHHGDPRSGSPQAQWTKFDFWDARPTCFRGTVKMIKIICPWCCAHVLHEGLYHQRPAMRTSSTCSRLL